MTGKSETRTRGTPCQEGAVARLNEKEFQPQNRRRAGDEVGRHYHRVGGTEQFNASVTKDHTPVGLDAPTYGSHPEPVGEEYLANRRRGVRLAVAYLYRGRVSIGHERFVVGLPNAARTERADKRQEYRFASHDPTLAKKLPSKALPSTVSMDSG